MNFLAKNSFICFSYIISHSGQNTDLNESLKLTDLCPMPLNGECLAKRSFQITFLHVYEECDLAGTTLSSFNCLLADFLY